MQGTFTFTIFSTYVNPFILQVYAIYKYIRFLLISQRMLVKLFASNRIFYIATIGAVTYSTNIFKIF